MDEFQIQSSAVGINMMLIDPLSPETVWDAILSRNPGWIVTAFKELDPDEQENILKHLERMTKEEGWHIEQMESAQVALEVIRQMSSHE